MISQATERALEPAAFLRRERDAIVEAAYASLRRAATRRYGAAGREEIRRRLERLYDEVVQGVSSRNLGPIVAYARGLARERFDAGYDLSEVQTAFNALEEAAWARICLRLPPERLSLPLGLVGTVLGAAKDALAREYVRLATKHHAPSLDLRALFEGGAAVWDADHEAETPKPANRLRSPRASTV